MLRLTLIVITFTALIAGVAANAQSDGGCVAPELSNPMPGHLHDQDYDVDRRDRPTARGFAVVGRHAARPRDQGAE